MLTSTGATTPSSSSRRRLFPQRRPSLASLTSPGVHAPSDILPLDWNTLPDDAADSDDSSNSSPCGSVKINRLSCLDWSGPGEAPESGQDSLDSMRCEDGSLPQDGKRERLKLCEMSQEERPPTTSASKFMVTINPSESCLDSHTEQQLPSTRPSREGSTKVKPDIQEQASLRDCSRASELTAHWDPNPSDDTVHRIHTWDGALKLWTIATSLENGKVQVHILAQLTVTMPEQKEVISAKRISFPVIVRNGAQSQQVIHLNSGQDTLTFTEDMPVNLCQEGELTVVRDVQDMKYPLNFYFSFGYDLNQRQIMASIPSLRPKVGKMRSESVYIAASYPPLTTKPVTRREFSTWKLGYDTTNQVSHYERTPLLPLYPERFSDDIHLQITDPYPVLFRSLEDLDPSDVVWNFDLSIERLLGVQLVCRMSLVLHVGTANRLLNINSHGWTPEHSVINGRLATLEWRQIDGMTLFKQLGMINGPLRIKMIWQRSQDFGRFKLALPTITDLKVLSGKITCKADRGKMRESSAPNPSY
jgi:hypothetical protein